MLRILARDDVAYRSIAPRLSDEHFRSARNRQLMALLRDADGRVSGATSEGGDDEVIQALTGLALEPLDGDPLPGYPEEVWARLQEFLLRRRSTALRQELQKMNPVTDPRYDELFQRLIAADGELRRLRDHGHVPA
jgi:hypothetical protein